MASPPNHDHQKHRHIPQPHQPQPLVASQTAFKFSTELMRLLDKEIVSDALWWLDNQAFAVNPKSFQELVLDPYLRGTKYASFLRTMHKMGFARLSRSYGMPKGIVAFACPNFIRGQPQLLKDIKMNNTGKQAQKAASEASAASSVITKTSSAKTSSVGAAAAAATQIPPPVASSILAAASAISSQAASPSANFILNALNPKKNTRKSPSDLLLTRTGSQQTLSNVTAAAMSPLHMLLPLPPFQHFQQQQHRLQSNDNNAFRAPTAVAASSSTLASLYQKHLEESALLRAQELLAMDALNKRLLVRRQLMLGGSFSSPTSSNNPPSATNNSSIGGGGTGRGGDISKNWGGPF